MAETFITADSKKIHFWDRTIGANSVLDEFALPGEYPLATYSVVATGISGATSSDHLVQLMAGSSLNVRIRRIQLQQVGLMTTASEFSVNVLRLTTAGTGGGAITPAKYDTSDGAAGATAMSLPSAKGTESTLLDIMRIWPIQTYATAGGTGSGSRDEMVQLPNMKPIIIPAGTSNGLALKIQTGRAGLTVDVEIEFVETSF